jgi:putative Ca2+/H+ antiporter (TMEM165/GDT1 family)
LYDAFQMPAQSNGVPAEEAMETVKEAELKMPKRKTPLAILIEAFCLTFMAEWGDRTQIATIALAASNPALGVTAGAILGHGICTAIAVIGGRLIAGRISERMITGIGGCLFLLFGAIALWEGA